LVFPIPYFFIKPLSLFKPDPNHPRNFFDIQELETLGASLKKKQIVPCLARSTGVLIDGERRYRAAKHVGLTTLDVIVTDENLTESQVKEMQLVSALHRAGLSAYEQFVSFSEWLKANPSATAKDLAQRIDRDPAIISRVCSLGKCVPAVVRAAEEGRITPAHWYPISQLPPEEQEGLLNLRLSTGAGREAVAAAGRRKRTTDTARVSRVRLPVPTGVVVSVEGKAIGLTTVIQALETLLKLAVKAEKDGLNIKTFKSACEDKAPKGAPCTGS